MALPFQNISFPFPRLTKDCVTGRLKNAALSASPAHLGSLRGPWPRQTPQESGQARPGLGGLDASFLEGGFLNPL